MSKKDTSSKSAIAGLFAAIIASLCCITPVFSILAGIGGIAGTFFWVEPFRPYLITLTIFVLGFAWYQKLNPRSAEELACACDENEKPSFWQSKRFLGIITLITSFTLTFPSYSHLFYSNSSNPNASLTMAQDTTKTHKIVFEIKGMTCVGCENHIKHDVGLLNGVKSVDAIYSDGSTIVEYLPSNLDEKTIIEAINNTGYTIIEKPKN